MILTMKAISLALDVDKAQEEAEVCRKGEEEEEEEPPEHRGVKQRRRNNRKRTAEPDTKKREDPVPCRLVAPPGLMAFLGYALCPANSVFGPWVKYEDYQDMISNPVWVRNDFASHCPCNYY